MSNSQIVPGGFPIPALATVAVDNTSIFGSGSERDPLRAASQQTNTIARPAPGQNVVVGNVINTAGQRSTATVSANNCAPLGLAVAFPSNVEVTYQSTGVVTLTQAQWEAVTEDGSALTPGSYYYLSATLVGHLTDTPPAGPDFVVPIGIALADGLSLQLQLGLPVVGA